MSGEYDEEALKNAQAEARRLIDAWQDAQGPFVSPAVPDDMVLAYPDAPLGDPACLDLVRRDSSGECPVVLINHDLVRSDSAW